MKSAFAVHKAQMKKKTGTLKIKLQSKGKVTKGKKRAAKVTHGTGMKPASNKSKNPNQKNDQKSVPSKKKLSQKSTSKTTVKSGAKVSTTVTKKLSLKNSKVSKSSQSSSKRCDSEVAKTGSKSHSKIQKESPLLLSANSSVKAGNSPLEAPTAKALSKSKSTKETVHKSSKKSAAKRAATTDTTSLKHPTDSCQEDSASESYLDRERNSVALTPISELRATKQASKNRMSVKITPLKSGQDISTSQRKRKSSVANSKDAKKLKIKLLPSKFVKKSNTTIPISDQKKQESPRIVNFLSPQHELSGTDNGQTFVDDSGEESALLFEWLISPVNPQNFFDNLWEKKPLLVRRHKPQYFKGIFSTELFNSILKKNDVQFGKHLDITSYTDGKRETHNPEGRAHAPVVWDYFNNGCSVRLLNPQTYSDSVWKLLSVLQEHFGSFCGANVYLTPAATQGFAPHYDDIEAFILQLEGKKRWKLYSPQSDSDILPRFSSGNLMDADIGKPILDTVLEEGDVLYFPRGFIHQAMSTPDTNSLHLTVSTCQRNSWGDFVEKLIGVGLQTAIEEDVDFRVSLPRDYLTFMGVVNSDMEDERRTAFMLKIRSLFQKLSSYAPIDSAVDQMAKELIHCSLPPVLTDEEKACMVYGSDVSFVNGEVISDSNQLTEETEIRLIRRGCLRLVTEENEVRIYHCMENPRVYHGKPKQHFVIPPESAPGVEFLILQYPKFVKIGDLILEGDLQGKVDLATILFEKALIRTKYAPAHKQKKHI